jgi:tryptophan synthase alpha chain
MSGSLAGRISQRFEALAAARRTALIPYIAAGDPDPAVTVDLMHALVRGGADVIELGVPFSDPMADGPAIQRASERAIANGVGLAHCIEMVREFRLKDGATPVVLMGYANPIERIGATAFVRQAAEAGVDGVLVVDYPPEESSAFAALLKRHGMDAIYLVAPTTTPARLEMIAAHASGYIYYVALKGVTGAAHLDLDDVAARLPPIRARFSLPIGVGFGIREPASARAVAALADAVVIGSRMVQEIESCPAEEVTQALEALTRSFREALDS